MIKPVTHIEEPGILASCENLHMMAMGSADVVPDEAQRIETYLQRRLDQWKDYQPIGAFPGVYDGAVKLLVMTALAEWRACPWNPKNSRAEAR